MDKNYVSVKVRFAEEKDIPFIVKISLSWIDGCRENRERVLRETINKGHRILVAEKDQKIMGFFDIRSYKDWIIPRKTIHIEHMFIAKGLTGKGIGSQIMERLQEIFKDSEGLGTLYFYTEGGEDIQHFVEKHGFINREILYCKRKKA